MGDEGRWGPSVAAVERIAEELQDRVDFGLTLFPDPANMGASTSVLGCLRDPDPQACVSMRQGACAAGVTTVPIARGNGSAIATALDTVMPLGGTPTSETLESLLSSFAVPTADPDQVAPPKYVLLVTDGQPTCPAGNGAETTPADIDASNAAIEALASAEVRTYVIGYDTTGPGNEALASVLDGFAQRGGTGDTAHRPVENEEDLLAELQGITGALVTCSLDLDNAPARPEYVRVTLDGNQVNLDQADGWRLVGDKTIELQGGACDTFKSGTHLINVTVECHPVGPT
jgi:hypothetical protein